MNAVHKIRALVLLCGLATLSCTVPPPSGMMPGRSPASREKTYEYRFDLVWQRLIFVIAERQLPIKAIEKDSGVLATDAVRFDPYSEIGRCALTRDGFLETIEEGRYSLSVLVVAVSDSTTSVRVNVHTEKFSEPFLGRYDWRAQPSTGCIEVLFFLALNAALASSVSPP